LVGLEFRNPPEFRFLRNSSFRKRETKLFFLSFVNETRIRNSNPETKLVLYRRKRGPDTKLPNKQTVARMGPLASRGDRGAIRFIEDTWLQNLLCTCCMHRDIRESPGRIRRSCLCKHPYSASATECQQRWHKLAPSGDSLQYFKQLSSSRALLAAQDAPRLRIGPGQKSTAAWRGYIDTSVWPKCRYSIRGLR
jgi:hypothetical protein